MRVLFDTNVVLDLLLARQPHAAAAARLFDHVARKRLDGLLGATTVTTVHYLATKALGAREAKRHAGTLLSLFEIAAVSRVVLAGALELAFPDYENAVLHEAARQAGATAIVTRDAVGFAGARLRIYGPGELLQLVEASSAP